MSNNIDHMLNMKNNVEDILAKAKEKIDDKRKEVITKNSVDEEVFSIAADFVNNIQDNEDNSFTLTANDGGVIISWGDIESFKVFEVDKKKNVTSLKIHDGESVVSSESYDKDFIDETYALFGWE